MADSRKVAVVPLKGSNYPTWKKQCRMALMKEVLWKVEPERRLHLSGMNEKEPSLLREEIGP